MEVGIVELVRELVVVGSGERREHVLPKPLVAWPVSQGRTGEGERQGQPAALADHVVSSRRQIRLREPDCLGEEYSRGGRCQLFDHVRDRPARPNHLFVPRRDQKPARGVGRARRARPAPRLAARRSGDPGEQTPQEGQHVGRLTKREPYDAIRESGADFRVLNDGCGKHGLADAAHALDRRASPRSHDTDACAARAQKLGFDRLEVRSPLQVVGRKLWDLAIWPPQDLAAFCGARGGI